jgi:hypothetical protein
MTTQRITFQVQAQIAGATGGWWADPKTKGRELTLEDALERAKVINAHHNLGVRVLRVISECSVIWTATPPTKFRQT